jgi:DNA/RNA-binding domain of Phe-tRNA-synthetase-like protein
MMERRRDLNDALKKRLLRLCFQKPDFLPHFVCFEKFLRVKVRDAPLKLFLLVLGFHRAKIFSRLDFLTGENIIAGISGASGLMEITIQLPGVKLGTVEADGVRVEPAGLELAQLLAEVCERKRRDLTVASLADEKSVRDVRAMLRAWGMDPSKYRPSSEALLRRVIQGKGLYRDSNVVDMGNLGSIETGWPFGCYDRSRIQPPIEFRHGVAGETYEGIGKQTWHLQGRPLLSDSQGPFGSPISDSTRSMITESAHDLLVVLYVPANASDASIEVALKRLSGRLTMFAGASATRTGICCAA